MHPLHAKLSLQDCQRFAFENSERLSIGDLRVLMEKDRIAEVRGMALPQLSAHVDYVAAGEAHRFLKKHKTINGKASLIVPLFNFGGASNKISEQETRYEASLYDNERLKQEILYEVSQAYFRVLESQKIENIVRQSLSTLEEQRRVSQDFYGQGLIHQNDLLLIDVQVAQREQDLIQASHNVAISIARLNRLMGFQIDAPTEIEDILAEISWKANLETCLKEAKECHPELISLQIQIKAACYAYKAEKGALYPSIYAFTDYSTTNDYTFPYTHGLDAGIGIEINLFDGGTTWAKIRRREKEYLELQYRYKGVEEDLELTVRTAYYQAIAASNKIPLALKGIQVSEENLKITQDQFGEGFITTYDLLNDEERLAQARSNYWQALYDFHQARLDLCFAAGMIQ